MTIDVDIYNQTRLVVTEIENCAACIHHERLNSSKFYCLKKSNKKTIVDKELQEVLEKLQQNTFYMKF